MNRTDPLLQPGSARHQAHCFAGFFVLHEYCIREARTPEEKKKHIDRHLAMVVELESMIHKARAAEQMGEALENLARYAPIIFREHHRLKLGPLEQMMMEALDRYRDSRIRNLLDHRISEKAEPDAAAGAANLHPGPQKDTTP